MPFLKPFLSLLKKPILEEDLRIGDIILFDRLKGLYRHCAIYAGNGYVIHFNVNPVKGFWDNIVGYFKGQTEIRLDRLADVAGGSPVYLVEQEPEQYEENVKNVVRALKRVGERSYDLLSHNCHHLCQEITGNKKIPSERYLMKRVRLEESYWDTIVKPNNTLTTIRSVLEDQSHISLGPTTDRKMPTTSISHGNGSLCEIKDEFLLLLCSSKYTNNPTTFICHGNGSLCEKKDEFLELLCSSKYTNNPTTSISHGKGSLCEIKDEFLLLLCSSKHTNTPAFSLVLENDSLYKGTDKYLMSLCSSEYTDNPAFSLFHGNDSLYKGTERTDKYLMSLCSSEYTDNLSTDPNSHEICKTNGDDVTRMQTNSNLMCNATLPEQNKQTGIVFYIWAAFCILLLAIFPVLLIICLIAKVREKGQTPPTYCYMGTCLFILFLLVLTLHLYSHWSNDNFPVFDGRGMPNFHEPDRWLILVCRGNGVKCMAYVYTPC
ncbi:uncharacterized protein LOC128550355 isoform X2 [Mercenaria mercenaria]|uniref:uncharacterized protein LOC128550355 isoform X2 n=1 Tax=Mercenaria mercenaria TaxID=6596 RepID=UPI00234E4C74|nr:uncharacterized protein LOC128550355 isoform X2 [Mercenaria mercenaria]